MKSILRRRPSPALVISCIALFVSLGGVSYGVATGFIDSREIKNNEIRSADLRNNQIRTFDIRNNEVRGFDIRNSSVQGRDVALNTLTGADIAEGELGKVPSATSADTAGSATSVAGVTRRCSHYKAQAGSGFSTVFNLGGLTLRRLRRGTGADGGAGQPQVGNGELIGHLGGRRRSGRHHGPRSGEATSRSTTTSGTCPARADRLRRLGRRAVIDRRPMAREQLADVRGTDQQLRICSGWLPGRRRRRPPWRSGLDL